MKMTMKMLFYAIFTESAHSTNVRLRRYAANSNGEGFDAIRLSYICSASHRAKNCNLCARALHHNLSAASRSICLSLVYGCDGGCDFKNNPTLMFTGDEGCIEEKCGDSYASVYDLQRAISNLPAPRNEVADNRIITTRMVKNSFEELENELYASIAGEKCRSNLVQNHLFMGFKEQAMRNPATCTNRAKSEMLPTVLLIGSALVLSVGIILTFKVKGKLREQLKHENKENSRCSKEDEAISSHTRLYDSCENSEVSDITH